MPYPATRWYLLDILSCGFLECWCVHLFLDTPEYHDKRWDVMSRPWETGKLTKKFPTIREGDQRRPSDIQLCEFNPLLPFESPTYQSTA